MGKEQDEKLKEICEKLDCVVETQEEILKRVKDAEKVTEPIRSIAGSAWSKTVYALGWGVLILVAIIGYYLLQVLHKLPKVFS